MSGRHHHQARRTLNMRHGRKTNSICAPWGLPVAASSRSIARLRLGDVVRPSSGHDTAGRLHAGGYEGFVKARIDGSVPHHAACISASDRSNDPPGERLPAALTNPDRLGVRAGGVGERSRFPIALAKTTVATRSGVPSRSRSATDGESTSEGICVPLIGQVIADRPAESTPECRCRIRVPRGPPRSDRTCRETAGHLPLDPHQVAGAIAVEV